MTSSGIIHDQEKRRFHASTENGMAVLDYVVVDEKTLNFHHTFVPVPDRGRGIAGRIVERALEYASGNGFRVIPSCPYVEAWVEKNPRFKDIIA